MNIPDEIREWAARPENRLSDEAVEECRRIWSEWRRTREAA